MTHTVIGFFRNSSDAYTAADKLKESGFDISNVDVSSGPGANVANDHEEKSGKIGSFFKSLFSDDDDNATRYSQVAKDNSMITVHASNHDEAERAADILDSHGAMDIDSDAGYGSEDTSYSGAGYDRVTDQDYDMSGTGEGMNRGEAGELRSDSAKFSSDKDHDRTSEASIPIIEEQVNVGKREVKRGGVRVRSRIIEKPVEETLRLREERVRVERTPADREASEADLENFHEETVEVHEYSEEPMISKRSRVVEEVRVGKDVHEREETVRERTRKTEVDIENIEDEDKLRSSDKR